MYKERTVKNTKLLTHIGTGAQCEHGRNRKNPLELVLIYIGEEIANQDNNDNDRTHVKKNHHAAASNNSVRKNL